jgi:hypothetical protein
MPSVLMIAHAIVNAADTLRLQTSDTRRPFHIQPTRSAGTRACPPAGAGATWQQVANKRPSRTGGKPHRALQGNMISDEVRRPAWKVAKATVLQPL